MRYKYCINLFDELYKYQYVCLKGEPLSLQAYGKLGYRYSSDIDILVLRKDLHGIEDVLRRHGFFSTSSSREDKIFMLSSSHQIAPYLKNIKQWGSVIIDINLDILWGEFSDKRINISEFISNHVELNIYDCKVKALSPLKSLIQVALHHYNHINSIYHLIVDGWINPTLFRDIYYLWKNNRDVITLDNLYHVAYEYGVVKYMYYMLYFTNKIYDDMDLQNFVDVFKTIDGVALLDCYGLSNEERKLWKIGFKERLEYENLSEIIKSDLNEKDFQKLERLKSIFG